MIIPGRFSAVSGGGGSTTGGGGGFARAGTVLVQHANGTNTVYQASADTDIARGTALSAAVAAAVALDWIVVGPGNFDLVTGFLKIPAGSISLIGAGIDVTQILSQTQLTTGQGAIIVPGNNSFISNLTVLGNSTGVSQACIGFRNIDGLQPPFTNARVFNVRARAESDVIYFNPGTNSIGTSASLILENCSLEAVADVSTILGSYTDQTLANITHINCDLTAVNYASLTGTQTRVLTGTVGTSKAYGCRITATGDASIPSAHAVSARTNAIIELHHCTVSATTSNATGSAFDLIRTGGTLTMDQTSSFNPGKTSGTLNWVTAPTTSYATVATITATSTAPTFSSGSLVLAGVPAGGYILRAQAYLEYAGATFSANNIITLSLVRTTPNQGTLTGSVVTIPTGTVTTLVRPIGCCAIPDIIYNATTGENPTFALFIKVDSLPTAGSLTISSGAIFAQSYR